METIPKETLVHILQFLPYDDLKRARLVCQRFLDAATEKRLWLDFRLNVSLSNIKELQKILQLSMMKNLKKVIFTGCSMKNDHVKLLVSKEITHIQIGLNHDPDYDCNITKISTKLLSTLVQQLKVFKYHNSLLSEMKQNQTVAILKQINTESQMSCLEIFYNVVFL